MKEVLKAISIPVFFIVLALLIISGISIKNYKGIIDNFENYAIRLNGELKKNEAYRKGVRTENELLKQARLDDKDKILLLQKKIQKIIKITKPDSTTVVHDMYLPTGSAGKIEIHIEGLIDSVSQYITKTEEIEKNYEKLNLSLRQENIKLKKSLNLSLEAHNRPRAIIGLQGGINLSGELYAGIGISYGFPLKKYRHKLPMTL